MPDNLIPMPATRSEREKHRKAGELMVADKARHLVYARAIQQWNAPPSTPELWLNRFFTLVAIAGGIASMYFVWHQVSIWVR